MNFLKFKWIFYLSEPSFGTAEEGSAFPVRNDLVEESHLTFDVRNKATDAKPEQVRFNELLIFSTIVITNKGAETHMAWVPRGSAFL